MHRHGDDRIFNLQGMTSSQAREAALREIKEGIKKNKTAEAYLGKASLAGQKGQVRSRLHPKASPDLPRQACRGLQHQNPAMLLPRIIDKMPSLHLIAPKSLISAVSRY
jgi:hypothetical protein